MVERSFEFVRRTNREGFDIVFLLMLRPAWDETETIALEQSV